MQIFPQVYNLTPPSDEIVKAYMELQSLPSAVLQEVVVPQNENDAATLVRTYLGEDRVGPANTHQNDPEAVFNQAMAGPDATPPPLNLLSVTPNVYTGKLFLIMIVEYHT